MCPLPSLWAAAPFWVMCSCKLGTARACLRLCERSAGPGVTACPLLLNQDEAAPSDSGEQQAGLPSAPVSLDRRVQQMSDVFSIALSLHLQLILRVLRAPPDGLTAPPRVWQPCAH